MIVPKKIDLTGQTFGQWLVLEEIPREKGVKGGVKWKCRCSCGTVSIVSGQSLRNGTSTKCKNCSNKNKAIDMTGQTTKTGVYIIERVENSGNEAAWRCICPKCGRQDWKVRGSSLRRGVSMCEHCAALNGLSCIEEPYYKDITGNKYGKLLALERVRRKGRTYLWKCLCDCGRYCEKELQYLENGDTISCGCLTSKKNFEIARMLEENNIPFEEEKILFKQYRFDFYVNNKYIIEFDGIQHFKQVKDREPLEKIRKRDLEKNQYCFDNNIPIIRIPYSKNFTFNDLILEKSNFILTKENENEYYQY